MEVIRPPGLVDLNAQAVDGEYQVGNSGQGISETGVGWIRRGARNNTVALKVLPTLTLGISQ